MPEATIETTLTTRKGTEMTTLTKTEKARRIRALAATIKADNLWARNTRVEIGHRVAPTTTLVPPPDAATASELCYPDHDDLNWLDPVTGDVPEGAVLHLYFSSTGPWGELLDVVVVWIGTAEHPPRVIDTRFVKYPA